MSKGVLYVVATPIGNLDDVTLRALKTLQQVDQILAEDTRHTRRLLNYHGISTPMLAMHEHNEHELLERILARLESGASLAIVSDAGTPLISDPGFPLVRQARLKAINVVPIPGPSALICALSAAGLPTDRFLYVGFPPRQSSQRKAWLDELAKQTPTLICYESSHRIIATLTDMAEIFGSAREVVIGREITKLHETFLHGSINQVLQSMVSDPDQQRGEFVLLIHGVEPQMQTPSSVDSDRILRVLADELPVKQAAVLTSKITGEKKNALYQRILDIKNPDV